MSNNSVMIVLSAVVKADADEIAAAWDKEFEEGNPTGAAALAALQRAQTRYAAIVAVAASTVVKATGSEQ